MSKMSARIISNNRFIIPLQKKIIILQLASIVLVRVFTNILIPSVRMTLKVNKCSRILCAKPLNERLIIHCKTKTMLFWLLFSGRSIQNILQFSHSCPFSICRYSPVESWSNQDTTVYCGLVFCAFS